jgi:hypothetical protein
MGQKFYKLEEPIIASVRGKPFLYDGLEYDSERIYGIKRGDSIQIKGVLKFNKGRYVVDFKDCINCAINDFFIEPEPAVVEAIEKAVSVVRNHALDSIRREDSILKLKIAKNKELKLIEFINNCQYSKNEIDEFDGIRKKITTKYYLDSEAGMKTGSMSVQLSRIGNSSYIIFEHFVDLGCTSPYDSNKSFVKFKLENNDIVSFYHRGDIDCVNFRLIGLLTTNDMQRLSKSPIALIRLEGTESSFDIEDVLYRNIFIDKLKCIQ